MTVLENTNNNVVRCYDFTDRDEFSNVHRRCPRVQKVEVYRDGSVAGAECRPIVVQTTGMFYVRRLGGRGSQRAGNETVQSSAETMVLVLVREKINQNGTPCPPVQFPSALE